ncbi:MAG: M67 family metallopeptidase [Chloroflexi bacterium]|nr:M67 family metallopeptidase [Chloroflexota bacterium]
MKQLVITQAHHDEIIAHAQAGAPNEVCGLLAGRAGRADALWRARNVAADPRLDYEMNPQTLLKQFEFEEQGQEMVAIYHSHPESPAYPSATDALRAYYPDSVYVICSLADAAQPVMAGFRMIQGEAEPMAGLPPDVVPVRNRVDLLMRYAAADGDRPARYELYSVTDDRRINCQVVEIEEVEIILSQEAAWQQ